MTPWVMVPRDADAARRAALEELDLTLAAVECVVDLLVLGESAERHAVAPIAETLRRQLERGRRALRRLSG